MGPSSVGDDTSVRYTTTGERPRPAFQCPLHGFAHRRALRNRLERTIELLLMNLNAMDGDPDFEPGSDAEPSLGWAAPAPMQSRAPAEGWAAGDHED